MPVSGRHDCSSRLHFDSLARGAARRVLPQPWRRSLRLALGVPEEACPEREVVFSIGIYAGRSPYKLRPWRPARNPVLRAEDVTDCNARFVADPFMIRQGNVWHMFFEVFDRELERGLIGLASSPDLTHWRYEGLVLKEDFHLSYPHVFRQQDEFLMIPECGQTSSVRLYRSVRFPWEWELQATLFECSTPVDASVFRHDDRWWILVETSGGKHDTLRLFHAPDLLGPWSEHRASPLVEGNAHVARPAGRVIEFGGRLLRFTQDCAPIYGRCVRAFEVSELTSETYKEAPRTNREILAPRGKGWNRLSMHHIDAHELRRGYWVACVDGLSSVPKPA